MRRICVFIVWLLINPGVGSTTMLTHAKDTLVLRFAHVHPADADHFEIHFQASKMRELLIDKGIDVRIYPSSQLGSQRDIEELMRLGAIDLNIGGTATFTRLAKRLAIIDLAYIWKDFHHLQKALGGEVGEELKQELLPLNLRVLAYSTSWGWRNIGTKDKGVRNCDDLKGLKIRTIPAPVYVRSLNAMGAIATPLAFGELYTAIQTNIVDGYEHTPTITHAFKLDEVINYYSRTEHMLAPLITVISEKAWEKLTDEQKHWVSEAAVKAAMMSDVLAAKKEEANLSAIRRKGVEIIEIDKQPFIAKMLPFNRAFAKKINAEDILEHIMTLE